MKEELTYWITLAFLQGITVRRKNEIYVQCWKNEPRISIIQLFEDSSLWDTLGLTPEEMQILTEAKAQLPNNSFLAENLISQGYDIIPLDSPEYPRTMKTNLGTGAPTVIFTKGNKQLLQDPAIAIVGSRNADAISLQFTSNIAQQAVAQNQVVVSGFAKGIDQRALDATLAVNGKSIIVLPQGITTFNSGFRQYYKHIVQGRVLVLSTFHPNNPWSVANAMERNKFIYALPHSIYVAQSDDSGGTWSGVIDGLRKKRQINVRYPDSTEKNANMLLIQKGAQAVDMNGSQMTLSPEELLTPEQKEKQNRDEQIRQFLAKGKASSQTINERLSLGWSDAKTKTYLRSLPFIEEIKEGRKVLFSLKGSSTPQLFDMPEN